MDTSFKNRYYIFKNGRRIKKTDTTLLKMDTTECQSRKTHTAECHSPECYRSKCSGAPNLLSQIGSNRAVLNCLRVPNL